jgi:hypothetical protein
MIFQCAIERALARGVSDYTGIDEDIGLLLFGGVDFATAACR